MAELAHADPFILKEKMGVIGAQLYASAWGIDRTDLAEEVLPKDKSLGNSQVLPHDYTRAEEIEVVIREIGSQVASRLRAHDKQAGGFNRLFAEHANGRNRLCPLAEAFRFNGRFKPHQ